MPLDKTPTLFCTRCFATEVDGSWDHVVYGEESNNYCTNCGGGNTSVKLPRWAVEDIRQNASWVGKRYYPHQEDGEKNEELHRLRALVTEFPGRTAEELEEDPLRPPIREDGQTSFNWCVTQKLPGKGKRTSIYVKADGEQDALERARTLLPYYPEEMLRE